MPAAALDRFASVPTARVIDLEDFARRRRQQATKPGAERVAKLLETVKRLESDRDQWFTLLREAYELFLPQRNPFWNGNRDRGGAEVKGQKKGREVLDSTPSRSLKRWASRKQQQLMPPNRRFAKLIAGLDTPEEQRDEANRLLEEQTDILFGELNQSNMTTEIHEGMLDAGISTGVVTVEDGGRDMTIRFAAVPADQALLEEGPHGTIENFYRVRRIKAAVLRGEYFPRFELSPKTARELEQNAECMVDIVECYVVDRDRGFVEHIVLERVEKHVGFYRVLDEAPWIAWGALKLAGETYRRGPVLDALADARTLQRVKELELRNAAVAIAGVYTAVDDDVLDVWNTVFSPGAIIPVGRADSLQPLESNRDFDLGRLIIKDLQESIENAFDLLRLGDVTETPVRTATEVDVREAQAALDTGSSSARLNNELVLPVIRKAVTILVARGRMVPIKVDGRDVDVELEGPLSRAQDTEEISRVDAALAGIAPLGPAALLALDPVKLAKKYLQKRGVWAEVIRTDAEILEQQQQVAQAAQAAAGQQLGGAPGDTAAQGVAA